VRIAVVGGGAWGTALAAHCIRAAHAVRLWMRREEAVRDVVSFHQNRSHLSGILLPPALEASTSLGSVLEGAELILVVVPSEFSRATFRDVHRLAPPEAPVVSATKGLETDTLLRMSEVAAQEAPGRPLAVVSGPSFALEVARELPTALVAASTDHALAESVQQAISTRVLRVYRSDDVVGVELGGALKNVIAIAAGIVDGLGYGHNTVAALVTRGLAEITRLALVQGGRADTLAGLAGLGDLVLTCTGGLSRNRRVGQALGAGRSLADATQGLLAEGVRTTLAACALAERSGIDMPIARAMRGVLYEDKAPRLAVDELMLRSLKRE
jgi:glycerol-3-phosphate dehydrogenase (NAD(P)+)